MRLYGDNRPKNPESFVFQLSNFNEFIWLQKQKLKKEAA